MPAFVQSASRSSPAATPSLLHRRFRTIDLQGLPEAELTRQLATQALEKLAAPSRPIELHLQIGGDRCTNRCSQEGPTKYGAIISHL